MKKIIALLIIAIIALTACIDNKKSSASATVSTSGTGEAAFSGKWPGEFTEEENARFIHYETVEIEVILTKDSEERSISFAKGSEKAFSGSIKGLEVGTWQIQAILYDSDEVIGSKTQNVTIVEGTNTISLLFSQHDYSIGPGNFADMFIANYIPEKIVGFFGPLGIAYLGIESIDIGFTDGLGTYDMFNPTWTYLPDYSEGDGDYEVTSGSGIIGTVSYTYDADNQITQANYTNDNSYGYNLVVEYNTDLSLARETYTDSYTSDTEVIDFNYTDGYLTEFNGINLTYTDGKITNVTEYNESSVVYYMEDFTYDSTTGHLVETVETEYDLEDDDTDGDTTEVKRQETNTYTYDGDQLESVRSEETWFGSTTEESIEILYTYNSSDLTELEFSFYIDETINGTDANGDSDTLDTAVPIFGERVEFTYSEDRVYRVDCYSIKYDYSGASVQIDEERVAYYLVNYIDDANTELIIEIK